MVCLLYFYTITISAIKERYFLNIIFFPPKIVSRYRVFIITFIIVSLAAAATGRRFVRSWHPGENRKTVSVTISHCTPRTTARRLYPRHRSTIYTYFTKQHNRRIRLSTNFIVTVSFPRCIRHCLHIITIIILFDNSYTALLGSYPVQNDNRNKKIKQVSMYLFIYVYRVSHCIIRIFLYFLIFDFFFLSIGFLREGWHRFAEKFHFYFHYPKDTHKKTFFIHFTKFSK